MPLAWRCMMLMGVIFVFACCYCRAEKPFANDQCPDLFKQPLEYRSVVQFRIVPDKSHTQLQCAVITQCSVDRLPNLERLARAWDGAISAAVYVPTTNASVQAETIRKVEEFATKMTEDRSFHGMILISLLYGHEDSPWRYDCPKAPKPRFPFYPINNLRNLAVIGSGGPKGRPFPLFFLLDVDFAPSVGLHAWVQSHASTGLVARCNRGELIVLPAFDSMVPMPDRTVSKLLSGIAGGTVEQFHWKRHGDGHKATNYLKWKAVSGRAINQKNADIAPYAVQWRRAYEPYVIVSREKFLPYDERYRGYTLNKIVQLEWMASRGATFHVLPRYFVVEERHKDGRNYLAVVKNRDVNGRVSKTYELSMAEIAARKLPSLSNTTRELYLRHYSNRPW